eukprot:gene13562-19433_t
MDSTLSGRFPDSTCGGPKAGASNIVPTSQQNDSSRGTRQLEQGPSLPSSNITHFKGCVEDSELPSLVDGEIRVLGSTLHPTVAKYYRKQATNWKSEGKSWEIASQIIIPDNSTESFVVNQKAKKLMTKCLQNRIGLTRNPKMDNLPEDIGAPQGVEARRVGNNDKRVQLRGELALHATKKLEPGFVVSSYRAYVMFQQEHTKLAFGKHPDYPNVTLSYVDSVGYGNLAALVNDCIIYPFGPPEKEAAENLQGDDSDEDKEDYEGREKEYYECGEGGQVGDENARLLPVNIRGFPFLFLVVTLPIKPGQELLFKYGYSYW